MLFVSKKKKRKREAEMLFGDGPFLSASPRRRTTLADLIFLCSLASHRRLHVFWSLPELYK
ncbi:hypothetical protein BRADI_5g09265v3 [Brachypodium distachyon]|uniref:Uncharacterized protein n=1 Tax=Brachypodium distachyon TaxID=15368 RepID=A0A0Q3P1E0_BRADI|nr:hypothetical protein BRADI_5g09265v3 [Brachypodium distachyon]